MAHSLGRCVLSVPASNATPRAAASRSSCGTEQQGRASLAGEGSRGAQLQSRRGALKADAPQSLGQSARSLAAKACRGRIPVYAGSGTVFTASPSLEGARALRPVVVIDNYDSFTYNLCQYLGDLGCPYVVHRNDEITIEELRRLNPSGILISPGPGTPDDSGISLEVVRQLGPEVPLFGVCMGLQCMGQAFGGAIVRAPGGVMHGKTSEVFHEQAEGDGLLGGLPNPFTACRYHSLVIDRSTFPEEELEVTAWTADGLIMGVRHRRHRFLEGVQFHPESIITQNGKAIVANFVRSLLAHAAATPGHNEHATLS